MSDPTKPISSNEATTSGYEAKTKFASRLGARLSTGLLILTASFTSVMVYKVATGKDNQALSIQGDLFSYTKEPQKPRLSEIDLQKRLSEHFGAHVYVAPVDGSGLYIAIVNGAIYYTEPTAQLLMQGDVYSLSRSEYLSERFESELHYSRELLAARQASKRPMSNHRVLLEPLFEDEPAQPIASRQVTKQASTPQLRAGVASKRESPISTPSRPLVENTKEASEQGSDHPLAFSLDSLTSIDESNVNPVLLDIARSLNPSDANFSSSCLQVGQGARSISEMSFLFDNIPEQNGAQEQCGMTFAQRSLPTFKDDDLITYKAEGEEKAVINIMSDYTCSFCARFHSRIPALNAEGITVRVFPYGRSDYFTSKNEVNVFANNFAAALCVPPAERKKVFEDLLLNHRTYSQKPYPSVEPSAECLTRAISYKLIGNIFNTKHQTPLIFYSNGQNQIGDSLTSVSAIVQRALSI
ncbi:hypothetical protein ABXZ88_003955 [Vibrio fluvialis]